MMPVLVILTVGIAVYCITLPGAGEGVAYYLKPNLKDFSTKTVLAAWDSCFTLCPLPWESW